MGPSPLRELLAEAQRRGFLGPGPVDAQLAHAERMAELLGTAPTAFCDLGSGGGLPGLVLAQRWTDTTGILLDAQRRRCDWLSEALDALGARPRVTVGCGRAEELARDPALRAAFPLVVARSFGPPAATAECAAGLVAADGVLAVSEPPGTGAVDERWPPEPLAALGFGEPEVLRDGETGLAVLRRQGPLDERWPRRTGIPWKRPLWRVPSSGAAR